MVGADQVDPQPAICRHDVLAGTPLNDHSQPVCFKVLQRMREGLGVALGHTDTEYPGELPRQTRHAAF